MSSLDYRRVDDDLTKMMESSSEDSKKLKSSCCWCWVGFIFTLSLTGLLLWLSMIPSAPVIYLSYNCYVDITGTGNTSLIYVELIPRNTNMVKEIYYDHFNVSLTFISAYFGYHLLDHVYNDSASGFHQGYPMKDPFLEGQYRPNVTFSSESGTLKNDPTDGVFYVDVAVTWRIMESKTEHKMMVHGHFQVEISPFYMYEPGILTIRTTSAYLSNMNSLTQLK